MSIQSEIEEHAERYYCQHGVLPPHCQICNPRSGAVSAPILRIQTSETRRRLRTHFERQQNFDATVFVYQLKAAPHTTRCVYFADANDFQDNPDWIHTGTIEPAAWIEHLMNEPGLRAKQIESISA